jgi:hypothetical protein
LQSPGSWILLARWCGVYSWRIDGLWALPGHIKKWGSTEGTTLSKQLVTIVTLLGNNDVKVASLDQVVAKLHLLFKAT